MISTSCVARYSSLSVLVLALVGSGCVSLDSIRERDFDAVTIPQVEAAAGSGDPRVHGGLVALLEQRLEDPQSISLDLALEALASLLRSDDADSSAVIATVRRCATKDVNEEIRYLALDVLVRWEGPRSRVTLEIVRVRDPSDLVREHAAELLAESPADESE